MGPQIDVNKPFTARWVMAYNKDGDRVAPNHLTGGDYEVQSWKDLAKIVMDDPFLAYFDIRSLEFQTYHLDENGEPIDSSIKDYIIDWVEGQSRLAMVIDCD